MDTLNLYHELEQLLRMNSRYCMDDGTLLKNQIVEDALAIHPLLIKVLLGNEKMKKKYAGKVKLILIDPPYYFAKIKPSDTFCYNSNFRLSTWLTFMRDRLKVARELLANDGVILCHIKEVTSSPRKTVRKPSSTPKFAFWRSSRLIAQSNLTNLSFKSAIIV